jgi:hypothetical protein
MLWYLHPISGSARELTNNLIMHLLGSQWTEVYLRQQFLVDCLILIPIISAGLRLVEKRSLPCPNRLKWLTARDELYEEVMHKAWNKEGKYFGQSYEETDVLDSAVLIMPLVFFMHGVS